MELKDVILSTLAEMEEEPLKSMEETLNKSVKEKIVEKQPQQISVNDISMDSELMYLNSIRERLFSTFLKVFQAPNNSNIEAKVDMTLNFLEYTLATIDARVQKLEKGKL